MLPAVLFGGYEQAVVRCPAKDTAAGVLGHVRIGIVIGGSAVPDFASTPGSHVGDPNRPGTRLVGFEKIAGGSVALLRGAADERDTLAVQRPLRIGISVDARSDETHGLGSN